MGPILDRRGFLGGAALAALPLGRSAARDAPPLRIGLLCVKSGPLASGGIAMEQGLTVFLRERGNVRAGRKIALVVADTGGSAAGARPKTQELVERDKAEIIVGPLAAYEALAISDYIRAAKVPMLSLAAAEDLTQRKPNPYFVRPSDAGGQCSHPLAYYAATERKFKRMATIADDFAFGHEQVGGFLRVFEDNGGRIVKKLWPPLNAADYAPYLSQIGDVDAVFIGFAGVNGLKFIRQYAEFGLKVPLLGGQAAIDESLLQQMGDAALGIVDAPLYTLSLDTPSNRRLIRGMDEQFHAVPGGYSSITYTSGQFIEAALQATGGQSDRIDWSLVRQAGLARTGIPTQVTVAMVASAIDP